MFRSKETQIFSINTHTHKKNCLMDRRNKYIPSVRQELLSKIKTLPVKIQKKEVSEIRNYKEYE